MTLSQIHCSCTATPLNGEVTFARSPARLRFLRSIRFSADTQRPSRAFSFSSPRRLFSCYKARALSAVLSAARLASRSDDRELCTRMASTQSGGAGDPSNPRRPSLSISTAVPEGANQQGSSAAAAHQQQHSAEGRSPASGEQTGSAVGGSRGQQRNFSAHARSQSLAEHHNHHASPTSPPSAGNESGAGGQGGASDLVRRHHTLSSTSSSRLVRLERSRARLAL